MSEELREQYFKEHPERVGETDIAFRESLYTEWLESKLKEADINAFDTGYGQGYNDATSEARKEINILHDKLQTVKDSLMRDEEIIEKSTKYKNRGVTALEKYIDYEILNAFEFQRERTKKAIGSK